jgi:membrane associated rhomboid family serine protease
MFFPFHDDNPTVRKPLVTCALIAANVIAFLWFQRLEPSEQQETVYRRGLVPIWITHVADPKPIQITIPKGVVRLPPHRQPVVVVQQIAVKPPSRQQILLSPLSSMFLHGGWWHLLGNMWFLWLFGNNVEDRLGPLPYLALYLLGGLLAAGCHWARFSTSTTPVIGASGAVAVVLGAYACTWPWARVHTLVVLIVFITVIDLPALLVLGMWFIIQILEGTREGVAQGVAWWAHIGGFIAGMLLMPLFSAVVGAGKRRHVEEQIGEGSEDVS